MSRDYEYYNDLEKIKNVEKYETELKALNALIGVENQEEQFKRIIKETPTIVLTFKYLIALSQGDRNNLDRKHPLEVFSNDTKIVDIYFFDNEAAEKGFSEKEIDNYYKFFCKFKLSKLFGQYLRGSVQDYISGVLVGLDASARKNRSGKRFEELCEVFIANLCEKYGVTLYKQLKLQKLEEMGFNVPTKQKDKRADFVLLKGKKVINIETNNFNGGGSKVEGIIDSYILRQQELNANGMEFVYITDGTFWNSKNKYPLKKSVQNFSHFMNLRMAEEGMLEELFKKIFD